MSSTELTDDLVRRGAAPAGPAGSSDTSHAWFTKRRVSALCVVVYAAIALLIYAPVSPLSSAKVPAAGVSNPAGSDPFQMSWFLSYVPHAIAHGLSLIHTNLINYPQAINLPGNTDVPFLGILGWPITATLGPIATFNFLIRLAFFSSSVSMFFVLGRWCRSWQARFIGGLFYGLSPYMTAEALHLDLAFIPIPPILLLLVHELIVCPKVRAPLIGIGIGVAAGIEFLISPDIVSGCGVMAVIALVVLVIRHRPIERAMVVRLVTALSFGCGVFLVIAGYQIFGLLTGAGHLTGPVLAISNLEGNSADIFSSIAPTSSELVTAPFTSHLGDVLVSSNLSENGSYLGIPLLVVLALTFRRLRDDAMIWFFLVMAGAAYLISMGGHLVIATWISPIPLPEDVFSYLPLLDSTIPVRYALYVVLFVTVVFAIGIDRIWLGRLLSLASGRAPTGSVPDPKGLHSERLRLGVLSTVVVLSLLPNVPFRSVPIAWPSSLPSTVAKATPPGTSVAVIPNAGFRHSSAMAWQAIDGFSFPLISGYANIMLPNQSYGAKQLPVPSYFTVFPTPPATPLAPSVRDADDRKIAADSTALRAYLAGRGVGVLVFTGLDTPIDGIDLAHFNPSRTLPASTYWFLTESLGQPYLVAPGYVLWRVSKAGWIRPAA